MVIFSWDQVIRGWVYEERCGLDDDIVADADGTAGHDIAAKSGAVDETLEDAWLGDGSLEMGAGFAEASPAEGHGADTEILVHEVVEGDAAGCDVPA
jgi:hypothetical protein